MQKQNKKRATISMRLMAIGNIVALVIGVCGIVISALTFDMFWAQENLIWVCVLGFSAVNVISSAMHIIAKFLHMKDVEKKFKEICKDRYFLISQPTFVLQGVITIVDVIFIILFFVC